MVASDGQLAIEFGEKTLWDSSAQNLLQEAFIISGANGVSYEFDLEAAEGQFVDGALLKVKLGTVDLSAGLSL